MIALFGIFIALTVYASLIKGDIPLSYLFKGQFHAIKQIYVDTNFTFQLKAQLIVYGLLTVVVIVVALLFQLPKQNITSLLVICWIGYPIYLLWHLNFQYHSHQFNQLTAFLQHFLAHFQASSKVYLALEESLIITQGKLKKIVKKALDDLYISGDINQSFGLITHEYPHFILHNIQTWIASAETYGLDQSKEAIALIHDDIDDWIEDTNLYIQQLIQMRNKILILTMLSLLIAIFNQNMLSSFMDLSIHSIYHSVIYGFLLILIFTFLMATKMLSGSWLLKGECLWNKSSL